MFARMKTPSHASRDDPGCVALERHPHPVLLWEKYSEDVGGLALERDLSALTASQGCAM